MSNISTLLNQDELNDLESFIDSFDNKLLSEVFDYSKSKDKNKDFVDLYIQNSDTTYATLRSLKSKLNRKIAKYHIKISKDYTIERINTNSDFYIESNLKNIISKDIFFETLYIFDTYIEDNKNRKVFKVLDRILNKVSNNVNINILSNFNDDNTRDYYHKIMKDYEGNVQVKYVRESLISNSSIFYCLFISDTREKFLYYNESLANFVMVKNVGLLSAYDKNFYNVLLNRFNYYFYNQKLLDNYTVIDVELNYLENKNNHSYFQIEMKRIVLEIKNFLNNDERNKDEITLEANRLIGEIKKLKILFTRMRHSNILLYAQVRISELLSYMKIDTDFPNSRIALKETIDNGLFKKIYQNASLQIKGNKFLILEKDVQDLNMIELRKKFIIKPIINNIIFIDLYPNHNFNTIKNIQNSLNNILIQKEYIKVVDIFLKQDTNLSIFIKSSLYKKLAFRAILEIYMGIKFNISLHLSEEQRKIIDIDMKNSFVKKNIYTTIKKYEYTLV